MSKTQLPIKKGQRINNEEREILADAVINDVFKDRYELISQKRMDLLNATTTVGGERYAACYSSFCVSRYPV